MPTSLKIRTQRTKIGMSQAELAYRLRKFDPVLFKAFDVAVISRIESSKRLVKTIELVGLATVLGCKVANLVDEVDE